MNYGIPPYARMVIAVAAFCFALTTSAAGSLAEGMEPTWKRLGEDLELAQVSVNVNPFLSSELLLLRTNLKRYRASVVKATEFGLRRGVVRDIGIASHAVASINANFFDEEGKALGLVISRGIINQDLHRGGSTLSGIFQIGSSGLKILDRTSFDAHGVVEAVQSGPRLLVGGNPVKGLRDASKFSKRSGVCIDGKQRLILYCVSSGFLGMTLQQIEETLLDPEIGCVDALNFDGGSSSQFWISKSLPGAPSDLEEVYIQGSDSVPVVLELLRRD